MIVPRRTVLFRKNRKRLKRIKTEKHCKYELLYGKMSFGCTGKPEGCGQARRRVKKKNRRDAAANGGIGGK